MTMPLPSGYVGLRDAALLIEHALFVGRPENPHVLLKLREQGLSVREGESSVIATQELWRGVDGGKLHVFAITPSCITSFPAAMTDEIPLLRRVGSLSYLRPQHRRYQQFVDWFGPNLTQCALAVRREEAEQLARAALCERRKASAGSERRGRPSLFRTVAPVVKDLVETRKWNPTMSQKALAHQVNYKLPPGTFASDDTVTRVLDQLYGETGDRRFARMHRRRRTGQKHCNGAALEADLS